MISNLLASVCETFGLGRPCAEAAPIGGGRRHRLWRLTTERGVFAVKEMRIDEDDGRQVSRIERAFELERSAYEAGVPMPRPIAVAGTGGCLAELDRGAGEPVVVRAHEWVEGEALHHTVYPADVAANVAQVIARIHGLRLPAGETLAEALRTGDDALWLPLAERVERSDIEWRWEFRGLLPTIRELEAYVESARADTTPLIMSHRDADQKNWMRRPAGELLLVDWDAAGRVHPRHEVAALALRWAGVGLGEPDWRIVRAWIQAYREAGSELDRILPGDLGEFVSVAIWWFEFNVRKALGERGSGEDERRRGEDFARREFKSLPRLLRSIERWERALGEV